MAQKKTAARKKTSRKKSSPKRMTQKQRARRNQYWALGLFFLALLSLLAVFGVNAIFIGFLGENTRRLIGAGFFALPFCLGIAATTLFLSRGRPVKGRVFSALITPFLVGCLVHSFIGSAECGAVSVMMEAGKNLTGGGLLSGYTTAFLITYISRAATIILFLALTVVTILASFDLTVIHVVDWIRDLIENMPHGVEYEEEYYEEEEEHAPLVRMPKRRRPVIDVPLDGEERPEKKKKEQPPLNLPPSKVKTPAEVLAAVEAATPPEPYHVNEDNFHTEEAPETIIDVPIEVTEPAEITPPADLEAEPAPETPEEGFVSPEDGFTAPEGETEGEQKVLYNYPPLSLLTAPVKNPRAESQEDLRAHAKHLAEVIKSFGIEVHILNIVCGPSITRYEIQLDPGVKFSRLTGLADDIALALGAASVYIAPIPNKSAIGIEVPNKTVQMVHIQEVIASKEFTQSESSVAFAMGKDISGNCVVGDIAKLPHLLIAGTTGSGKSVCMNSIIISLLYKSTPEEVRLIMIDPKMVELGIYNGIPHLLVPVVTDPRKASGALQWAVLEMMKRYKLFADNNVRDMQSYNRMIERRGEGDPLPQIVIVIDELADLMVVARKEVEDSIMRLTQMARAAGMHLIIATQRPSVDVITGVIKSNIPSRIAFAVASKVESNIILGSMGAEKLIGRGDMLFSPIGSNKPTRIQGCFISGEEVEAVVEHVKKSGVAEYSEEIIEQIERQSEQKENGAPSGEGDAETDEMLDAAIDVVVESGQASVSMLQRRLKLGYSRAARIVDQMEERGIVGAFEGAKPRQVLVTKEQWQEIKMRRESL